MGEGLCVVEVGPSEVGFLGLPALPGVRHLSLHPPDTYPGWGHGWRAHAGCL